MADNGSNGNGHSPRAPEAIDLDSLMPTAPSRRVRIEGTEYNVRQIIHFSEGEEADLRNLERAFDEAARVQAEKPTDADAFTVARRAAYDLAFWMVRALVPELPEQIRRRIRLDQAFQIAGIGRLRVTENPPSADTGTAPDVLEESSRPVSADSMASSPATLPA